MSDNNEKFTYTYSAPTERERREIDSIRRQYISNDNDISDKLSQLRSLDGKVKNPPKALGIVLGVVGILIFGLGLTMVLEGAIVFYGVLVMVVGVIPMGLAYPMYKLLLKRNKDKYGAQIIRLSEELLHEDSETENS